MFKDLDADGNGHLDIREMLTLAKRVMPDLTATEARHLVHHIEFIETSGTSGTVHLGDLERAVQKAVDEM